MAPLSMLTLVMPHMDQADLKQLLCTSTQNVEQQHAHHHHRHLDRAGIADDSVDLIISNCVVNLSPDKPRVLREAYRVLRAGGELYFSDVYSDRRVPEAARRDKLLWGECVSGALYVEDFKRIAAEAGFVDVRMVSQGPIEVPDAFRRVLGPAQFFSITYRLFKLPGMLETLCEDYGQVLRYKVSAVERSQPVCVHTQNKGCDHHNTNAVITDRAAFLGVRHALRWTRTMCLRWASHTRCVAIQRPCVGRAA